MLNVLKAVASRAALVVTPLALLYLAVEFLLFPQLVVFLPMKIQGYLHEGIQTLAQSSKQGVSPKHYVALVGDSHAAGKGDWSKRVNRMLRPDFHSAHIIHNRTGRDVISFGAGGAGSLRGLVGEPFSQYEFINASSQFELEPPEIILVYFYEGNDLDNNLEDISLRFVGRYDGAAVFDPGTFRRFIREVVHEGDPVHLEAQREGDERTLFFAGFLANLIGDPSEKFGRLFAPKKERPPESNRAPSINEVLVNGERTTIPAALQSPALELTRDELLLGVYVFEQSLIYLRDGFPASRIGVVYIPSPLSSYRLASEEVSIQTYESRESVHPSEAVGRRSDEIASLIRAAAEGNGMHFIDSRGPVRQRSASVLVHGPRDWKHFNETGYGVLAGVAVELIETLEAAIEPADATAAHR